MSIISAGTTTTTALSSTGNTDGTLQLQVNGTTPSVTLNTLGAIGVGSTPSYGTAGQVLTSGGSTTAPTWSSVSSSQWTTTGSDIYYNTGNVAVGTTSASYKFVVNGTSNTVGLGITGTSASGDSGIYYNVPAITGSYNIINAVPSASTGVGATFGNGNSTSGNAFTRLDLLTTGANGGDPKLTYTISGVLNWCAGVDNSDGDKYKISYSDTPGTNDYLTINANGAVALNGAVTTASGVGITFPATQSASSDANTLDDYEEGTWTPALAFGGGSTGLTYSNQVGNYTKIGNRVFISGYVNIANKGSSTGNLTITGLPFTSSSTSFMYNSMSIAAFNLTSISGSLQAYNAPNTSTVSEITYLGTGSHTAVTQANCIISSGFMINFSYSI